MSINLSISPSSWSGCQNAATPATKSREANNHAGSKVADTNNYPPPCRHLPATNKWKAMKGNKKMNDKQLIALAEDPFLNETKTLPFPARQIRKIKDDLREMKEEDKLILIFTE